MGGASTDGRCGVWRRMNMNNPWDRRYEAAADLIYCVLSNVMFQKLQSYSLKSISGRLLFCARKLAAEYRASCTVRQKRAKGSMGWSRAGGTGAVIELLLSGNPAEFPSEKIKSTLYHERIFISRFLQVTCTFLDPMVTTFLVRNCARLCHPSSYPQRQYCLK